MTLPASQRDPKWPLPDSPGDPAYAELLKEIEGSEPARARAIFRAACLNDFWFFNRHCLTLGQLLCADPYSDWYGKPWLDHPWMFDRCREIQKSPNGHLDLWPRFHFKTALITQSLTLWDLADDPGLRFGIYTNKLDKTGESFLAQIKIELETNDRLKTTFPDAFWEDPLQQAPVWDKHRLTMPRALNPKEPTISVFGLIGGMLTSYHFDVMVGDDIVVEKSVASRDQIETTTEAWRKSTGMAADNTRHRILGTHWAVNDTYRYIQDIGAAKLRYHDVYDTDGVTPVLRSKHWVEDFRRRMGAYNFAAQMRNRPTSGIESVFDPTWLKYYDLSPEEMRHKCNVYILVDTARVEKRIDSDYTVILVVGLAKGVPFGNFFVLDLVRDRMSLVRMTDTIFRLAEKWKPLHVLVEQVAAARDGEYIKAAQHERGFYFSVTGISENLKKEERIRRLQPIWEAGRIWLPRYLPGTTDGKACDLVQIFLQEEFLQWTPTSGSKHDDMLDTLAWIASPEVNRYLRFPVGRPVRELEELDSWHNVERNRKRRASPWATL